MQETHLLNGKPTEYLFTAVTQTVTHVLAEFSNLEGMKG
jgi:hypothetical protein